MRAADGRRLRDGQPLRRPRPPGPHAERARTALRNRLTLKRAMERHGFRNYRREWWHYEHRSRGTRYLDLSLGC